MKRRLLAVAASAMVVSILSSNAHAQNMSDGLRGNWLSKDTRTLVEIAGCPNSPNALCATVLMETPEPGEPSLVGLTIGRNFIAGPDGTWNGEIVTLKGTALPATLAMPRSGQLKLRTCVALLFCDEQTFNRAQ